MDFNSDAAAIWRWPLRSWLAGSADVFSVHQSFLLSELSIGGTVTQGEVKAAKAGAAAAGKDFESIVIRAEEC